MGDQIRDPVRPATTDAMASSSESVIPGVVRHGIAVGDGFYDRG